MAKRFFSRDASKGMDLENGKRHYDSNGKPLGGIKAKVVNTDNQVIEVEKGEVIITRNAVSNPKKYKIEGTTKEILSTLNQEGGGVPINDTEAKIVSKYRKGGRIPREKHKLYLGEEGGMGVSSKGEFETAFQMEKEGIDNETIRTLTGWFRNQFDKLWRYEISDKETSLNFNKLNKFFLLSYNNKDKKNINLKLSDFYKNSELFLAYPEIKNIIVNPFWGEDKEYLGSVVTPLVGTPSIYIKINAYGFKHNNLQWLSTGKQRADFKSVITHELQHVIQIREGISGGSSVPIEYRKLLTRYENGLNGGKASDDTKDLLLKQANENYMNLLGEIEARDSSKRMFFDKKTMIETPPYSLINFKDEEVIIIPERKIKFKTGGSIGDKYHLGGEIPTLIEKGVVDLKFHETTPEHAEIYGLTAEKPLYIQTLYINDNKRLQGIGTKVLHYIYSIAKQNGNDVIFGHINQKASFSKDEKETTFNDIDMVKNWLHKNGYAINEDNNDFHKVVKFKTGGSIEKEEEMEKEIPKYAMIDDEQFEVIGSNHKLDKVRVKNFASGETFEMPIDKWIVESLELGTQAKFKANGREYVGMVVIKNGQKSISLYKDDNYSGDAERIVPIRDIDISTLKSTWKKEMFELGGGIGETEKIEYFKPYKSVEELAELHRVPVSEILEQLHIGEKVEMEHTTDYEIARIIALQHIEESKKYYTLLENMEDKFELGGQVNEVQSNKIVFKPITTPL